MPDKAFLETYPLYKKFNLACPPLLKDVNFPAIHMYCEDEGADHTFNKLFDIEEIQRQGTGAGSPGAVIKVTYQCTSCHQFHRRFLIEFDQFGQWIQKVGQYPPWDISINKDLEKALGDNASLYKNGKINESQGYGIGAFAYYRRVIEETIDTLLEEIASLIPAEHKAEYETALKRVRETKVTEDKIDVVKDLLPDILRPEGMNPLKILHTILSEGLHGKTDDECLKSANDLRESIEFLVTQVSVTKTKSFDFTKRLKGFVVDGQQSQQEVIPPS